MFPLPPRWLQPLIVETFNSAEEAVLWYEVQLPSAPSKSSVTAVSPSEFQGRIVHGELLQSLLIRSHWETGCFLTYPDVWGHFSYDPRLNYKILPFICVLVCVCLSLSLSRRGWDVVVKNSDWLSFKCVTVNNFPGRCWQQPTQCKQHTMALSTVLYQVQPGTQTALAGGFNKLGVCSSSTMLVIYFNANDNEHFVCMYCLYVLSDLIGVIDIQSVSGTFKEKPQRNYLHYLDRLISFPCMKKSAINIQIPSGVHIVFPKERSKEV